MQERRRAILAAVEAMYPIDAENDGALRYVDSEDGSERGEPIPRYVLIQTHANGRRWHEFADTERQLLEYAESDEEWSPFLLVDLDTGKGYHVQVTCSLSDDVVETFAAEPESEPLRYGWGWIDGEDDELGNAWIQISTLDEQSYLEEEMAVIMCRDVERVRREHPEWIAQKEAEAKIIVDALNARA